MTTSTKQQFKKHKLTNCHWCQRPLVAPSLKSPLRATLDHVVPKCRAGRKKVWCCHACNHLKAARSLENWKKFMADNKNFWELYDNGQKPVLVPKVANVHRPAVQKSKEQTVASIYMGTIPLKQVI